MLDRFVWFGYNMTLLVHHERDSHMSHFVIDGNNIKVRTSYGCYSLTDYYGARHRGMCSVDGKWVRFVVHDDDIQFMCHFAETAEQIIRSRKVVVL